MLCEDIVCVCVRVLAEVEGVLELCAKYKESWVVGVDMAGDETLALKPHIVEGFRRAKQLGLHVTVHAGEAGPARNVQQAVQEMGAERIGHGYHVLEDPQVYQFARDRGVHFEVKTLRAHTHTHSTFSPPLQTCPMSSVFTSSDQFENHAIQAFCKDGVSFSLNTDDPGIIGSTLVEEYQVAETKIGLTQHQIMRSVSKSQSFER